MRLLDGNKIRIARSELARDINRRIVLNLVRKNQPISRADLSRQSGLQRSTVSIIIDELIAQNLIVEGGFNEQLPRGRKPIFLHLNSQRLGVIGINVRPQVTNMALSDLDGNFLLQESFPTPADSAQFVDRVGARILELVKRFNHLAIEGVGVSLPGRVDVQSQRLVFAPNLGWRLEDLKERLESITGFAVELENEANVCALAEYWFGKQASGVNNLIAVAVSEGIGVGMVLNGQLVRGPAGLAGEFGHVAIANGGPRCACGNHGCWEVYASNSAALRWYRENRKASDGSSGESAMDELPVTADFDDLLSLAEHGNPEASQAIEKMAHHLGEGLAMLVTGLAPDVIVVVGEVTRAWEQVGPIIQKVIQQRSFTHAATRIVASGPAPLPRLRGIIALVLQKRFGAPVYS